MAATVERLPLTRDVWNPAIAVSTDRPSGRGKKVSWAPDPHLTQVRVFSTADAPHAAAERSRSDQLAIQVEAAARTEAALPQRQRLGRVGHASRQAIEAMRPSVAWRPPPKVTLNPEWQVPAGDESSERAVQDGRVRGTLEAIYLHGSAIPNSPAEPEGPLPPPQDDATIPLVPLMPVDDEALLLEEDIPAAHSGVQAPPPPPGIGRPESAPQITQLSSAPPSSLPPPPPFPPPHSVAPSSHTAPAPAPSTTSGGAPTQLPPRIDNRALLDLLSNPALLQLVAKKDGPAANANQALEQLAGILGNLGQGLRPPPPGPAPPQPGHQPRPPPPVLPPNHLAELGPVPHRPPPGPAPLPPGRPPLLQGVAPPPPAGPRPPLPPHASPRPPAGGPPGWPPQERPLFDQPRPPPLPGYSPRVFPASQRPLQPQGEWQPSNGPPRGPPPQFHNVSPTPNRGAWEARGPKGGGRGERPVGRPENMRDKKMCLYFNTPQGCHKGENCTFYHARQAGFGGAVANGSNGQQLGPPAKRTKLDGNTSYWTQI